MTWRTGALAALLISYVSLPGAALAQDAARTHTVVRGETLWALSERFFGDPFQWRAIYEANADQIQNPHWIYPGQELVIPGLTGQVTGVTVQTPDTAEPQQAEPMAEVEPERPYPDPNARSTFYRQTGTQAGVAAMEGVDDDYAVVPVDIHRAAAWLAPRRGPPTLGRLIGFDSPTASAEYRETALPYERLRLRLIPGTSVSEGDSLRTFRVAREVPGVGLVVRPSGIVRVVEALDDQVVAEVVREWSEIRLDDFVQVLPPAPVEEGVYPSPATSTERVTIIAFGGVKELYLPGDIVMIDRGAAQDVAIGDEYLVYVGDTDGFRGQRAGKIQVVALQENSASARILQSDGAVFRLGTELSLFRKMP